MTAIALQSQFPALADYLSDTARTVGIYGELYLARLFEAQGHKVSTSHKAGDLTVVNRDGEIVHIEVKTARRSKAGTWQFCLYKAKHTNHHNADLVVLLCVGRAGDLTPFVLPSNKLNAHKITIYRTPQDYSGIYARYRQSIRSINVFEVSK